MFEVHCQSNIMAILARSSGATKGGSSVQLQGNKQRNQFNEDVVVLCPVRIRAASGRRNNGHLTPAIEMVL